VYFDDVALATPLTRNQTPRVGFDELAERLDRAGREEYTRLIQTHFLKPANKTN